MAKKLFDHIDAIRTLQDPHYFDTLSEEDLATFSVFMIHRIMSMNPTYLAFVNELQRLQLTPRQVYLAYINVIPRRKDFTKFIKAQDRNTPEELEILELLSQYFTVSKREAAEYYEIIKSDEGFITSLKEYYGRHQVGKLTKKEAHLLFAVRDVAQLS